MGQFSVKNENKEVEEGENDYLKFASFNNQGWKKQKENTFISVLSQGDQKNYDIFCVFDGHNGNEVSQFVKNHFCKELLDNIKSNPSKIISAINQTFLKMNTLMKDKEGQNELKQLKLSNIIEENKNNKKILNEKENDIQELSNEDEEELLEYTGCTACLIIIDENNKKLYFANIGNSEVLICGKNVPRNLASKHRPTDEMEKNRINEENGLIINDKLFGILNVTRTFGDFAYNKKDNNIISKIISDEPDIIEYDIKDDDKYIFMGTESVIECIDKKKFGEIINNIISKNNESLTNTIETIIEDNNAYDFYNNDTKFGFDNMTCTLIKIKNNDN